MHARFMRRELAFLADILNEADIVLKHSAGVEEARFCADEVLSRAILHSLMIIGEASKRVPTEVQDRHPGVPWRDLAGLRNRIVHDYPGVDLTLVWTLVTTRLPELRAQIAAVIEGEIEAGRDRV